MNNIYYIGFFDSPMSLHRHFVSPAGTKKMEYVASALTANGDNITILSVARPIEGDHFFLNSEDIFISTNIKAHFFPTFIAKNYIIKKLSFLWQLICLSFYILYHLKQIDKLVVYHSLPYTILIIIIKKFFQIKLILEVEEIYSEVSHVSRFMSNSEQILFRLADAYIFPTELLDKKINSYKKPSIIIYGNYFIPKIENEKRLDGKIHVIYSGTFNLRKGGALSAIASGEYLSSQYHIHITGKGSSKQILELENLINRVKKKTECEITYDGFIGDEDFIPYLQQFHIGLCTQNPNDKLSESCFPSKILLYMSNGLSVLSSPALAVKVSSVAPYLHFYKAQDPKDIADGIKNISVFSDTRDVVRTLDDICRKEMICFVQEVESV